VSCFCGPNVLRLQGSGRSKDRLTSLASREILNTTTEATPGLHGGILMDSILITGGAGYIGSQAAKQLSIMGFRPVVLDDLSSGYEDAVQWGPFVKADIGDAEAVYSAVRYSTSPRLPMLVSRPGIPASTWKQTTRKPASC
jgi:hypothetical protein